jgi:transglutaminase TgpA-like protein/transglutaminase superfamily protein/uncharacterized protein DUF4129
MTMSRRMTVTVAVACVLASTVLYPLFLGSEWFYAGAGAVMAVALSGSLSRLRVLPVLACLAISVLGLLLYLNLVFEVRHSLLWVIPTPASVSRLWHLAGAGLNESSRYAPPAPDLPGLMLLAAAGIGLMAVLTDLIAVRLRSTALAGLPLLVLYTVPITMRAPSGPGTVIVFSLGTAGYLAMLSADGRERIRLWGRLVSLWRSGSLYDAPARGRTADGAGYAEAAADGAGNRRRAGEPDAGPDTRALAAAGRRIGLASIVLALLVPLILPGLHASKLFSSGPGIGSGSSSSQSAPGTLSLTFSELEDNHVTTVLTYTTTASKSLQANDPQYLREFVSDELVPGIQGWIVSDYPQGETAATVLRAPEGLSGPGTQGTFTTHVNVASGMLLVYSYPTFLPMPYPAAQVTTPPGSWLADRELMVYSKDRDVPVNTYQVKSYVVDPTRAELNNAGPLPGGLGDDLALPPSYQSAALKQIADAITKNATTEYEKVDELATWLSGGAFAYNPSGALFDTASGLLNYLQHTRIGVCVQSAYAMTVLTRLLGIPARMVQGYTAGTPASGGKYVVKTSDAHAWTEVYFAGWGWIRFEPTPAGQGTATQPNWMTGGSGSTSGSNTVPPTIGSIGGNKTNPGTGGSAKHLQPADQSGPGASTAAAAAGTPWTAIALAVLAAIALACGVIAILAPPAQRLMSSHPAEAARRRRPVSPATVGVVTIVAAIVALSLYRLLSHTSGLDLRAGWATVGIAFGAAGAVVLVGPALLRIVLRRWRWMRARDDVSRAHTAWREFGYDLEDLGVGHRPSEPPRTLAGRVSSGLREPARDAIRRLALAEERASYAARPADSATLRRDGVTARRSVAAAARRGSRWRARIFPVSVLANVAEGAARIPDRLGALIPRRSAERRSAS